MRVRKAAIIIILMAVLVFVFLVPLPLAALEPVDPNFLMEPIIIYGSVGAKYLGYGAISQAPYGTWPFHGTSLYCIQCPGNGGYWSDCLH